MLNHIAFIMDGNRRFSKKNNISIELGYKKGMEQFLNFIKYQVKYNIFETSFFALSSDNYKKRPEEEKKIIFELINFFSEEKKIEKIFVDNKIKINLIGNIKEIKIKESIIEKFLEKINEINKKNKEHSFQTNVALNYDGQEEILNATKKLIKEVNSNKIDFNDINSTSFKKYLSTKNTSNPDIIVRSGNSPRLSGFYLWESKYSEIYLTEKFWPELTEKDFNDIFNWFDNIKRNFGK